MSTIKQKKISDELNYVYKQFMSPYKINDIKSLYKEFRIFCKENGYVNFDRGYHEFKIQVLKIHTQSNRKHNDLDYELLKLSVIT